MKKSRFTDSQIMAILKQHEAGMPIADLAREHNVSTATIYQWRAKLNGISSLEHLTAVLKPINETSITEVAEFLTCNIDLTETKYVEAV